MDTAGDQSLSWLEKLMGFSEEELTHTPLPYTLNGHILHSLRNGKSYDCGRLEIPNLAELRQQVVEANAPPGRLQLREVVADVKSLHLDPAHAGAFFQAASQFNLLEMIDPSITPEMGISRYEDDHTQGPACAVAAGAGTIYRNYFVPVRGQIGQSADNQIDCLADMGSVLGNPEHQFWTMKNGYALFRKNGLEELMPRLTALNEAERDALRATLRIGVQWDTEVTLPGGGHLVTQGYCSALPVAYNASRKTQNWEPLARLVLEASYEAALSAALVNFTRTGNNQVFLTLLGGGVFGNLTDWISRAIQRALRLFAEYPLDVALVSYGSSKAVNRQLVEAWK